MADDYSKDLIKPYKYWSIYIHQNQGYLGRCIVWCHRENAEDLTEATKEEQKELFIILDDLKKAVKKVFGSDWFNYAFLGNEVKHLHAHFVPRYQNKQQFEGIIFEDKLWGHNYKSDHSFITPESVLRKIQAKIKEALG